MLPLGRGKARSEKRSAQGYFALSLMPGQWRDPWGRASSARWRRRVLADRKPTGAAVSTGGNFGVAAAKSLRALAITVLAASGRHRHVPRAGIGADMLHTAVSRT